MYKVRFPMRMSLLRVDSLSYPVELCESMQTAMKLPCFVISDDFMGRICTTSILLKAGHSFEEVDSII